MKRVDISDLVREVVSAPSKPQGADVEIFLPDGNALEERQETIIADAVNPVSMSALSKARATTEPASPGSAPPQATREKAPLGDGPQEVPATPAPDQPGARFESSRELTKMPPPGYRSRMAVAEGHAIAEEAAEGGELAQWRNRWHRTKGVIEEVCGNLLLLSPLASRQEALVRKSRELLRSLLVHEPGAVGASAGVPRKDSG